MVPGALGYHEARAASRADLTGIPLAVAAGPVPIAFGGTELVLTSATLTPGGVKLRLRAAIPDPGQPLQRPVRELPGQRFAEEVRSTLQVTDDLGRRYRLRPDELGRFARGAGTPAVAGRGAGGTAARRHLRPAARCAGWSSRWRRASPFGSVCLLPRRPRRVRPNQPWPTPAEAYLAELASARSVTIATGEDSVELDVAKIVAAVADALLWTGALPPDSALLSAREAGAPAGRRSWRTLWARQAHLRARDNEPERAGLAVALPLRRATAVIESIAAHGRPRDHPAVRASVAERRVLADDRAELRRCGRPTTPARSTGACPATAAGDRKAAASFWFWPPVPPCGEADPGDRQHAVGGGLGRARYPGPVPLASLRQSRGADRRAPRPGRRRWPRCRRC